MAEATLEIMSGADRHTYSQSQLLSRPDVRTIDVTDSVYHRRLTRFRAIPIKELFSEISVPETAVVQCNGLDGFSANLDAARLFNTNPAAAKAFLAIEDPRKPWPRLPGSVTSAGPFYLVWTQPRASDIGREEWPYQIGSFKILSDLRETYPRMYPAAGASASVQSGFDTFLRNCFPCHKINGEGAGLRGPDLNLPRNPTEYFNPNALILFIRKPAQVRSWPAMAMPGFSTELIPDAKLSDLIAYLRYMISARVGTSPAVGPQPVNTERPP